MIKLFCFPYAGGSSSFYYGWKKYLRGSVSLRPIELSGRGHRLNEPLSSNIYRVVDDIYRSIKKDIYDSPFMLFGHSMGSLISFELYYRLLEREDPLPCHIFFSGTTPPNFKVQKKMCVLSEDQFLKEINDYGGTPPDFFQNEELLSIFLPILRSDIRNTEEYKYKEKSEKLSCSIDVFYGLSDHFTCYKDLLSWRKFTNKKTTFNSFKGNHFFLHNQIIKILDIINHRADTYLGSVAKNRPTDFIDFSQKKKHRSIYPYNAITKNRGQGQVD